MKTQHESKLAKEMLGKSSFVNPAIIQKKTGEKLVGLVSNDDRTGGQRILTYMSPEMAAAFAGHFLRFAVEVAGEDKKAMLHEIFTDVLNEKDAEGS